MKNKHYILLLLIFLLGIALRSQELISGNFLFLLDQGRDLMAVKRIVFDYHLTLIGPYTSLQGVFQGPFWYYLLAIPIFVLNGNPWGTIFLMFLISVGALCVSYLRTKRLFGKNAAIAALFLFAVSPEAVSAATYSWNPHPMWLLIALYIFVFYEVVSGKLKYHLVLWPLLAFMFHFQTALGSVLFIATLFFFLLFKREMFGKYFLLGLLLSAVLFLPQIAFDVRHDFLMTKSVIRLFQGSEQGLFVGNENQGYLPLLKTHADSLYYNFQTTFLRDGYLERLPFAMLLLPVFMLLFEKKQSLLSKKEHNFVVTMGKLVLIVSFLLLFLYPFPIRYWFLTGFQAIYIIIFGVLLGALWRKKIGKVVVLLIIIVVLFYDGARLAQLYVKPADYGGVAKIKGKIDAVDYIYNDARGNPFGLLIFTPPVSTDHYDYLVWWHGERKYGYLPSSSKEGVFYLLIEPDPYKPWSYNGWLQTVIKTGTVIETKELRSGLIVQKRVANEK